MNKKTSPVLGALGLVAAVEGVAQQLGVLITVVSDGFDIMIDA